MIHAIQNHDILETFVCFIFALIATVKMYNVVLLSSLNQKQLLIRKRYRKKTLSM